MAQSSTQSQIPQQRPQFSPPPQGQQRDFSMPNGRSNSFAGPSPSMHMNYTSPSPQQYSPNYTQAPPSKRQRLSPESQPPFSSNNHFPQTGIPQAHSPIAGNLTNGTPTMNSRPGLMAPPQRPVEKDGPDRSYDDILAGTGIDLEEEARSLAKPDYYSQPTSSFQTNGSFGSYQTNSFGQLNGANDASFGSNNQASTPVDPEVRIKREHERLDWEASRHTQHALWDMFLLGGTINDKIKRYSQEERLVEAQAGVLVNTQRNAPPPKVRVDGLEGASRVIDQGQSILDTKAKADRLSDAMKLVSLAAKARLTGLINASAKLALERREHSKGKVPDEWADIAVATKTNLDSTFDTGSPAGSTSLKRTFSQANSETAVNQINPAEQVFDQCLQGSRAAEEARLAKRQKRKAKSTESKDGDGLTDAAEALAAAMDPEKKTTKKERKAAESKFSEQQQHKNANDAARMATSNILGRTFGKKGKSYSWMTGGGPGAGPGNSAPSTPGKGISTSAAGTPSVGLATVDRVPAVSRGRRFRVFDEDEDSKVQARDVLLVLESDSLAARCFVKGHSSLVEGKEI